MCNYESTSVAGQKRVIFSPDASLMIDRLKSERDVWREVDAKHVQVIFDLTNAMQSVSAQLKCRCDEAYISRKMHGPECTQYLADELEEALRGE